MLFGLYGDMHAVTRATQEIALGLVQRRLSVSIVTPRSDPQPWEGLPASVQVTPLPPAMKPGDLAVQLRGIQRLAAREASASPRAAAASPEGARPADVVLFSGFGDLAMPKARVGGRATEPRTEFSFTSLEEALGRADDVVTYLERGVKTEQEGKATKDAW